MKRKTYIEIIIHLVFWIITFYFFTNNSFLRFNSMDKKEEYYSFILVLSIVYFNMYFLIPNFFTKQKPIKYFSILFFGLSVITIIEFLFIKDDILLCVSAADKLFQKGMLRWNFFYIFFRNTLFIAFFTMFKIYRDAIQSHIFFKEKTNMERINLINQIEMVKSKINVHFFFNTLHNIHAMAVNKSDKTADVLDNLTHLMKYVVVDSEEIMVSLKKEILFLQHYIELEKIRKQNVNLIFEIEGEVNNYLVPPMIFESFVNNAFKYNDFPGNGLIYIKISCQGKDILFQCENALDKSIIASVSSTGKGLINTLNRLDLHYKNFHLLEIDENEKYYKVKLLLKGRFL